jgi:formyltetrahydrofolate-dependent phosphoribosylglycinamide formyltransferase
MNSPPRLAVLLSGSGRTLQNLIDRIGAGELSARIVLVISNKADAYGLMRAEEADIPTAIVTKSDFPGPAFSERIFTLFRKARTDLVCLAGFLQLLQIPDDFSGRVLNIHPALLPDFGGQGMYGHHVHEAVLKSGVKESGCTVHLADNEYDRGTILVQKRVPVVHGDTPDTLADRVFAAECEAYPEAIRKWIAMNTRSDSPNN